MEQLLFSVGAIGARFLASSLYLKRLHGTGGLSSVLQKNLGGTGQGAGTGGVWAGVVLRAPYGTEHYSTRWRSGVPWSGNGEWSVQGDMVREFCPGWHSANSKVADRPEYPIQRTRQEPYNGRRVLNVPSCRHRGLGFTRLLQRRGMMSPNCTSAGFYLRCLAALSLCEFDFHSPQPSCPSLVGLNSPCMSSGRVGGVWHQIT